LSLSRINHAITIFRPFKIGNHVSVNILIDLLLHTVHGNNLDICGELIRLRSLM